MAVELKFSHHKPYAMHTVRGFHFTPSLADVLRISAGAISHRGVFSPCICTRCRRLVTIR